MRNTCMFHLVLFVLLLQTLTACQSSNNNLGLIDSNEIWLLKTGDIKKSYQDDREYGVVTLDNDLEVILVSDPNMVNTAVALSVNAGSFQDPIDVPGTAHLLEHLVYSSSTKYPEPNQLAKLVSENAGYSNAFTSQESTIYLLSVANNNLDKALDMLVSGLAEPLLDSKFAEKEKIAVNEEWHRAKKTDAYIRQRVQANTSNTRHPINKFNIGNTATFNQQSQQTITNALRHFHQQYYSANLMKLVLAGKQSVAELKHIAKQHFSALQNKQAVKLPITENVYNYEQLQQHIHVSTDKNLELLMLQFDLGRANNQWRSQPNSYVYRLLNSADKSALKSKLKDLGWINGTRISINPRAYANRGELVIEYDLTDSGRNNKQAIIAATLDYIALIKQRGVNRPRFVEMQKSMNAKWFNYNKPQIFELIHYFANSLHNFDAEYLLARNAVVLDYQPQVIQHLVEQLTVENLRIWHISKLAQVEHRLKYAEQGYSTAPFSESERLAWATSQVALSLPSLDSNIFPVRLTKQVPFEKLAQPRQSQLPADSSADAWVIHSRYFDNPIGYLRVQLQTPESLTSAKNHMLSLMIMSLYSQANEALKEQASSQYSIEIYDRANTYGMMEIGVIGGVNHQEPIVAQLISEFKNLSFTAPEIEQQKVLFRQYLQDFSQAPVEQQLYMELSQELATAPMYFTIEQKLTALEQIDLTAIQQFHQHMLANNYLNILAFGYYMPAEVAELTGMLRASLGDSNLKQKWLDEYETFPNSGNVRKEASVNNVGFMDNYVLNSDDPDKATLMAMLSQLMSQALFSEIRTEKQMGYLVQSFQHNIDNYPAIGIVIESNNTNLPELKSAVDEFILNYYQELKSTPEEVFEQLKNSFVNFYRKTPDSLLTESYRFQYDWEMNDLTLNAYQKAISAVEKSNKAAFVDLYEKLFLTQQGSNILIQLKGKDFSATPYY